MTDYQTAYGLYLVVFAILYGGKLFTVFNRIYKLSQDDEYLLYSYGFKETGKR